LKANIHLSIFCKNTEKGIEKNISIIFLLMFADLKDCCTFDPTKKTKQKRP
jgi:hypothetical protein